MEQGQIKHFRKTIQDHIRNPDGITRNDLEIGDRYIQDFNMKNEVQIRYNGSVNHYDVLHVT